MARGYPLFSAWWILWRVYTDHWSSWLGPFIAMFLHEFDKQSWHPSYPVYWVQFKLIQKHTIQTAWAVHCSINAWLILRTCDAVPFCTFVYQYLRTCSSSTIYNWFVSVILCTVLITKQPVIGHTVDKMYIVWKYVCFLMYCAGRYCKIHVPRCVIAKMACIFAILLIWMIFSPGCYFMNSVLLAYPLLLCYEELPWMNVSLSAMFWSVGMNNEVYPQLLWSG